MVAQKMNLQCFVDSIFFQVRLKRTFVNYTDVKLVETSSQMNGQRAPSKDLDSVKTQD